MLQPKKVRCIGGQGSFVTGNEYNVDHDGFVCFTPLEISGRKWDSKPNGGSVFEPIYTNEELLEYAEKMYPIGTKYKTASKANNEIFTASYSPIIITGNIEVGNGYIYYKPTNTWAEIVSTPEKIESFAIQCPKDYETNILWKQYIEWYKYQGGYGTGNAENYYYGLNKNGSYNYAWQADEFETIKPFEYIYELLNIPVIKTVGEPSSKPVIKEEYLKCLDPWRSLVGYTAVRTATGERYKIIQHDKSGYCELKNNESRLINVDIHSSIDPYYMTSKDFRVIAKAPEVMSLKQKYADKLAEVENLFPIGSLVRVQDWSGLQEREFIRTKKLTLDKYENHIRIASNGDGILWSTKYGMSKLIAHPKSHVIDDNEQTPIKLLSSKKKKPSLKQVVAIPTIKNRIK